MAIIKLLVEGGAMTPGPSVAQQLGPMGINIGKVISDVNSATSHFKGITVPVHLDIDGATKQYKIMVLSPPTSELIKKELKIEKASGARFKQVVGNLSIEQVIAVARSKHENLLSNTFLSTVKSVIGTCQALGTLIESKEPKEVLTLINEGKYKGEIESQKITTDVEKRKELDSFFADIVSKQEAAKKAEEAEKAAAEEAKAASATATPAPGAITPAATPTKAPAPKPATKK